jgi:hypothetical protein
MVTVVVPDVFNVVLGTEQVTPVKTPCTEHVTDTDPVKLLCGVTVTAAVADVPRWIVSAPGFTDS